MDNQTKIEVELSPKQVQALQYLLDKETNELFFGGAAGGGKTMLGCVFALYMCLRYDGIRGCFAREELKSLKESTLLTFFDICRKHGLRHDRDYHYDPNAGVITFLRNQSTIYLKELKFYPSDPEYDYLGSMEYTFTFIDEAPQVRQKGKNILRSRIRYKLKEYGLIAKQLETGNPSKEWPYLEFFKPHKTGKLPPEKKFIQALVTDNPFIDPNYIKNLQGLDMQSRERLLYGNWEYNDDPAVLCAYDKILDMFSNIVTSTPDDKYIIADIARFGDDRTVLTYWEGWACKRIAGFAKLSTTQVASKITEWRTTHQVPLSRVLVDEDGVGGGVKDQLHCKGFMGGRTPFGKENYKNLKAQCTYLLAKKINTGQISVYTTNDIIKNTLIEELEQIKAKDRDKDGKLMIVGKDEVKEKIGHSPDFADALMMRAYYDVVPKPQVVFI